MLYNGSNSGGGGLIPGAPISYYPRGAENEKGSQDVDQNFSAYGIPTGPSAAAMEDTGNGKGTTLRRQGRGRAGRMRRPRRPPTGKGRSRAAAVLYIGSALADPHHSILKS